MGGHGGLNILPQKRWNVYNRDNRTKVARDEAKAKKQDDEEQEKHMQAEREYRHRLLLQRAGHKVPPQEGEGAQTADGLLASIFDCKEEDSKAEHPENVEKRVEELRKRGNPDTQTSDAKFDERFAFAFAFGLGKVQPWYAKAPAAAPADGPSGSTQGQRHDRLADAQQRHDGLTGAQQLHHTASALAAGPGSPASSGSSSSEEERPRKRHKRDKHKQKKSHKSSKSKDKKLAKTSLRPEAKTVEELRAERVQRELAEKARSRSFLRSTIPAEDTPGVYNTVFGHAAALKKRTRA